MIGPRGGWHAATLLALFALGGGPTGAPARHDLGADERGRPRHCVTGPEVVETRAPEPLPIATRAWEAVPGVVRNDGVATFRLEVTLVAPAAQVLLRDRHRCLLARTEPARQLRDDGQGGDRAAGDLVYTSVPFGLDPSCALPGFWSGDPTSPVGVDLLEVGEIAVQDATGGTTTFLSRPGIGVLAPEVPAAPATPLAPDVVATPHLVNVRTPGRLTQRHLRLPSDALLALTTRVYAGLPDVFDFLVLFSTDKLEQEPMLAPRNFVAGTHRTVRCLWTGTGVEPFDDGAAWGSPARLLGVNALDAYDRGLLSKVAAHELLHQWVNYLDPGLGLSAADGIHFDPRSSAGSLVGGFRWAERGDGALVLDCNEGAGGAHRAAPIDRYMMGLIGADAVPTLYAYDPDSPPPPARCGEVITDIKHTVTLADIQAVHGLRVPGPATAPRAYALAFVAESHERFLDATELTFYDTLAAHFTSGIPAEAPDPYHGGASWVTVARFFGDDVTWRSDVLVCGNGRLEGPEECDDGNQAAGDGCGPTCRREIEEVPLGVSAVQRGRAHPGRKGRLRVAILGAQGFNPLLVAFETLRFGPAGAVPLDVRRRDVDRDGRSDLVVRFVTRDTGVACGDPTALLSGRIAAGRAIAATVTLRLAGCRRGRAGRVAR